jgi:hypothetical protein
MAHSYERSHEQLPRNERGDRLWPTEALERLQAAKALRESGKAVSLEAGLEMLATGAEEPSTVLKRSSAPEPWELVVAELRALRGAVERLEAENRAIREQIALPASPPADDLLADLKRRNAYLEGELRRRDEQPQARRPRWKVWARQ